MDAMLQQQTGCSVPNCKRMYHQCQCWVKVIDNDQTQQCTLPANKGMKTH